MAKDKNKRSRSGKPAAKNPKSRQERGIKGWLKRRSMRAKGSKN